MARRKTSSRKSTRRRRSTAASKSVKSVLRGRKRSTPRRGKSGRGGKVKSRKQAVAIDLPETRKKSAKGLSALKGSAPRRRKRRRKTAKRSTKRTAARAAKRTVKRTVKRTAKRATKRRGTRRRG